MICNHQRLANGVLYTHVELIGRQEVTPINKEALPRVQSHGPLDLVKRVPNTFIGQSLAYGWKQVNKANELNRYKREGEVVRTG